MWSPSQPRSANSFQNAGSSSVGASSNARPAARALRLLKKSETVSARALWSSVMAIDMRRTVSENWYPVLFRAARAVSVGPGFDLFDEAERVVADRGDGQARHA